MFFNNDNSVKENNQKSTISNSANQNLQPSVSSSANIISIVNQKGGVGKTTTAVNLAAGLSRNGQRVLLVDFDPQGNASSYLGINIASLTLSSIDVMNGVCTIERAILDTGRKNLHILPTNVKLGSYNQGGAGVNTRVLKDALTSEFCNLNYDYIIIDCQPSLSILTINAMVASNGVIIAMQAEYLALDGLSQLLLTLKEVNQKLNMKLFILGVVITMYDKRNKLCIEVREELVKHMSKDLFRTTIPRLVKLAESPSHGKTIFEYNPNGMASLVYNDLANEVIARVKEKQK